MSIEYRITPHEALKRFNELDVRILKAYYNLHGGFGEDKMDRRSVLALANYAAAHGDTETNWMEILDPSTELSTVQKIKNKFGL